MSTIFEQPVYGGPTDNNTRSLIDVKKKMSPEVTKQPPQWTKIVHPKMTIKTRHSENKFAQWAPKNN